MSTSISKRPRAASCTTLCTALLLAGSLSACGGGSGKGGNDGQAQAQAQDSTAVPASAGASAQAFISFQQGLDASDSGESLSLADFLPAKDDTAEPMSIG